MKPVEREWSEAAKDWILWTAVYLFAALTLLFRAIALWAVLRAAPLVPWRALFGLLSLVCCLFPLAYGLWVCRRFNREVEQKMLSAISCRKYKSLIATLLWMAYMAMELFDRPHF